MEIISDQDAQLVLLHKESSYKESIINNKQEQIQSLNTDLKKARAKNKILGLGCVGSLIVGGLVTFLLVK